MCFWLIQRFKEGAEMVKDDYRSCRPSTSWIEVYVEWVKQVVSCDCWLRVRMIAIQWGLKKVGLWKIITEDLDMQKICPKFMTRLKNDDQLECCMQEILSTKSNLLSKVLIGDETDFLVRPRKQAQGQLVDLFDIAEAEESKAKSKVKVMLVTFFVVRGTVHSVRWSISKLTKISWGVCYGQSMRRDESQDKTNRSSFTTKMNLLTKFWESNSSWTRRKPLYCNHLHFLPDFPVFGFSFLPA